MSRLSSSFKCISIVWGQGWAPWWLLFRAAATWPDYSYLLTVPNVREPPLNLKSRGPYSSSQSEIKFRRCLVTFTIKHEIGHFHVVVAQKRQRNVQKRVMHVQKLLFCVLNPLFILDVLVAFTSLNLKPRAKGRNIVGQQLPTLLDVTCCAKFETCQTF